MDSIGFAVCLMTTMMMMMMMISRVRAATYTIGDDNGWSTLGNYEEWAEGKTFIVGDSLIFHYSPNFDSVDEVNKDAYDWCTNENPISSDRSGSTTIVLRTSGAHYFKSMNPENCDLGVKLAINVCNVGVVVGGAASICVGL